MPRSLAMFPDFLHRYRQLPERCSQLQAPTPVAAPKLLAFNRPLAEELGIAGELLATPEQFAGLWAGNEWPPHAEPRALVYAGHQFGHFNPQLGDGRALLLGEVRDRNGRIRDLQWKGAGRTPYSRGGDGRSPIGPVLREYLVSEAMHALGIPTTRALAAVATGERVRRERSHPGAVMMRVADSHIRVGSLEYFAARNDTEAVQALVDEAIARHDPALAALPVAERYLAWLQAVAARQAERVAQWLAVGFVHGVMNTDNTLVSGDTIDYGPCAFLEQYQPRARFSAIDERGRYAYGNQPGMAQWNLARLAEAVLPLLAADSERAVAMATDCISAFAGDYEQQRLRQWRAKLGLQSAQQQDGALIDQFLSVLEHGAMDFTLACRLLSDCARSSDGDAAWLSLSASPQSARAWLADWRQRLALETRPADGIAAAMDAVNPLFIPRNHWVQAALADAEKRDDLTLFHRLNKVLQRPYDVQPEYADLAQPAAPGQQVMRTFCGT
ncbi:protein adenylyltransferase SelO [Isoalcanivorax beigongshangi]|uniref:Protein nucleotidyltransferase YdiU n=1 Tax=Isoalcanivorax beigongshangi TaxID=3238810 RepID=A0ABV4ADM2_9GAMM